MIIPAAVLILRNVRLNEPQLTCPRLHISALQADFVRSNGLDLSSRQLDPGFEMVEQVIIVTRSPILGDDLDA